jgi:hypothetical protein
VGHATRTTPWRNIYKISVRKPKRMNNFRETGTDDMVLKLNLEKSTDMNSTEDQGLLNKNKV